MVTRRASINKLIGELITQSHFGWVGRSIHQSDTPREAGGLMSDRRSLAGTSLAAETDAT